MRDQKLIDKPCPELLDASWRDQFPLFRHHPDLIYLDSAATAQKPQSVIDALSDFYSKDYATVHRAAYRASLRATELYHNARNTAAAFLHADPDEIIFTRGTTDGINLVAQSLSLQPGDEILISEMEHHSNIVPWQMAARRTGATLKWLSMKPDGTLDWEGKIGVKTKLVALAHISNVTGTIHPVAAIAAAARKVGARFLVDGAQAAPFMPVDVKALDCDFYVFSGHKCYGPTGIGILYGKKEILSLLPPLAGGGDMIERVSLEETTYQLPPLRFEAGTPIIAPAIALKAALDFIENCGRKQIEAHGRSLRERVYQELVSIPGLHILGNAPETGPLLSFHIDGIHPLDLASFLDMKGIAIRSGHLCAQPLLRSLGLTAVARCSFGLYNSEQEVDFFIRTVRESVQFFRGKNGK